MRALVFYFIVLCSLFTASFAKASRSLKGFSVDLIHRDSPLSPFYNPSLSPSELIKNAALRSISRSNRFGLSRNENKSPRTITIPDRDTGEYLMKYYIGTPPVERFAIADTGSDLIWVQCAPCMKCLPQDTPLFDPRKSSSFRSVSCDSQPCTLLPPAQRRCEKSGKCKYLYIYGDKSYNTGKLGVESINFGSKGGGKSTFPKLTFGCAYYNNDTVDSTRPKNTGLVGLGAGPLSLVSQVGDEIGHKFSYCLLPLGSNSTSKLKFGSEATIKGKGVVSTPLIIKSSAPTFYYLNLEGISVGKRMVKTSQTDGNIVIDSGTTFILLEQNLYKKFVTVMTKVFGVEAEQNPPDPFDLCFKNKDTKVSDDHDDALDFVFHFTGAKVRLTPVNLYNFPSDDLVCMLVKVTSERGLSIFGNQAQIGFQVEYDLKRGKVSFAPADCTKH